MIHAERIRHLTPPSESDTDPHGDFILYWMQASQRTLDNHALEYAVRRANALSTPLIVVFALTDRYPDANLRHYRFMLEGLREVRDALNERGIAFALRRSNPDPTQAVRDLAEDAAIVVCDRGYLTHQRQWRETLAEEVQCPLVEVETDVVVPVETASPKEEYTAGTFRPKLHRELDRFLVPLDPSDPDRSSLEYDLAPTLAPNLDAPEELLDRMDIDRRVPPSPQFTGGTSRAIARLDAFLTNKLDRYPDCKNDPSKDCVSHMSPYLHFGQISPLTIARRAIATGSAGNESYIEELIVRRELSMNFVFYNADYMRFGSLPNWPTKTLTKHAKDWREYVYSLEEFEEAQTHDPYWNAAQDEMRLTGKMHGYMRMYWGKKILEWTDRPERAYEIAVELNDRYELDGRDPNSYTGVAWCFGKHDRAWKERPVYGKVRYMNDNGLRRKFDIEAYVDQVDALRDDRS